MSKCDKNPNSSRPPLSNRSKKSSFAEKSLHTIVKSSTSGIKKEKLSPALSTAFNRNSLRRSLRNSIAKLFSNEENVLKETTEISNENLTCDPELSAKLILKESGFNLSDEEKELKFEIIHQLEKLEAINKNVMNCDCCLDKIISKKKLECLVEEIQEIKKKISSSKSSSGKLQHNRVSITVLRLPLAWTKVEGLLGKYDDSRRFDVFCLLRVKSDVRSTSVHHDINNDIHDIIFSDVFVFDNDGHDFNCKVEVYARKTNSSKILGRSTLKRKADRSTNVVGSLKPTPSRRNKEDVDLNDQEFQLLATGCLDFNDVISSRMIFNLAINEPRKHSLPLFGQFCCKSTVITNIDDAENGSTAGDKDIDKYGRLI